MSRVMYSPLGLCPFAHVPVLFALIFVLSIPSGALSIPLQIKGTYTGQVNGDPIEAIVSGDMDTTGSSLNHFELEFKSIPSSLNPFAVTNSWNSSYHGAGVLPVSNKYGDALNLFDLSGGNYFASRTVSWPSWPGEQIVLTANVSTVGGVMTATDATVNGTYTGPTDLIGVTDYHMLWTQIDPTTIEIVSTATLLREKELTLDAKVTSVYSGLSFQMPTNQQVGTYTFSNESYSNNIMSFDWEGTVAAVPEPGTVVLLSSCLIAFGVARSKRKS
jgi:hypothetical protein